MKWSILLAAPLKAALKRQGWTTGSLAAELGAGEASVKRWLSGKGLTIDRLERLCALADLRLAELEALADAPAAGLADELTLAQERALSRDPFLAFLFIVILGGTPMREIERDFELQAEPIEAALAQLEKLALIDRTGSGAIRPRVDRAIIWRKTPMRLMFEERMKAQFLTMDFSSPDAVYSSEILKLSAAGAAELAELVERHRREIQALADQDRRTARLNRSWYAMLSAIRPLDTSGLQAPAA